MKSNNKKIIIAICALLAITATVIVFVIQSSKNDKLLKIPEGTSYILFETKNDIVPVSEDDIISFKGEYSDLNSHIYYSKLNTSEKFLYKIFEYAFENCYDSFYVQSDALTDCVYNDVEILIFLSLDSPLAEQNFKMKTSRAEMKMTNVSIPGESKKTEECIRYNLEMNSKELMAKKKAAVEKADEIIKEMPENLNDAEKAKYLYKYLCNNTSYKDYNDEKSICYIYDALITGETHCDGFANALSLLYNKAGIKCFEKGYYDSPAQKTKLNVVGVSGKEKNIEYYETPSGHTWNSFMVDGKWYDCDCTLDSKDNLEKRYVKDVYFGFGIPDGFVAKYKNYNYKNIIPECSDSFLSAPQCTFETVNDNGIEDIIYKALKNSENGVVLMVFTGQENADIKSLAKKVCDYNEISVYYGRCDSSPILVYFALKD